MIRSPGRLGAMLLCVAWTGGAATGCATGGGGAAGSAAVEPAAATARGQPRTEAVALEVDGVVLHGTLELPAGEEPHTVALLIAGSGPTDRDGNTMGQQGARNSLKLLAEALAEQHIASLRYDKRGVGESVARDMREEDIAFGAFVDDAAAWIERLRRDARFSDVAVIGHSEGGLIGTLAARQQQVDALVLVASMGRSMGTLLREQLRPQLPPLWMQQTDSLLAEMEAGRRVSPPDEWPPPLQALFRQSVQPFLISVLPIDPATELAALRVPTLVVQGTTDVQTSMEDARLLAAAGADARLVTIEGMNHVLKMVSGTLIEQLPSYDDPTLPLAPELGHAIVEFLREATRR